MALPVHSGVTPPANPPLLVAPGASAPSATPPTLMAAPPRDFAPVRKEADSENHWSNPAATHGDSEAASLFVRKSPVLSGEAVGPRRITVGKEAAYEINMQNAGDVPADEVVVLVNVPAWADVAGAEATAGAVRAPQMGNTAEPLRWNLGRMEAKSHEKLTLRLVPRQSRPFDLSLRWDYKPVAMSAATIEVQEPKLAMRLEGPRRPFRPPRSLQAQAGQQRHRPCGKRGDYAVAGGRGREPARLPSHRPLGGRRGAFHRSRTHRAAVRHADHPGRGPRR